MYAATWSEVGSVYIHDITEQTAIVDDSEAAKRYNPKQVNVVQVLTQHSQEGFAIDWSPAARGIVLLIIVLLLVVHHCRLYRVGQGLQLKFFDSTQYKIFFFFFFGGGEGGAKLAFLEADMHLELFVHCFKFKKGVLPKPCTVKLSCPVIPILILK